MKPADAHNLLRPETAESLFILYRLTKVRREEIYYITFRQNFILKMIIFRLLPIPLPPSPCRPLSLSLSPSPSLSFSLSPPHHLSLFLPLSLSFTPPFLINTLHRPSLLLARTPFIGSGAGTCSKLLSATAVSTRAATPRSPACSPSPHPSGEWVGSSNVEKYGKRGGEGEKGRERMSDYEKL